MPTDFRLKPPRLVERDVTGQVIDFLEARKWRCHRLQTGIFRSMDGKRYVRFGKDKDKGQTDWLCVHRQHPHFYLEMKRALGRLSIDQELWILSAEQDGHRVISLAGRKEPLDWFMEEYGREFEK